MREKRETRESKEDTKILVINFLTLEMEQKDRNETLKTENLVLKPFFILFSK